MLERVLKRKKLSNRVDDNEETFHKRVNGHNSQIEEVLASLRQCSRVIEVREDPQFCNCYANMMAQVDCNGDLDDGYELVRNAFLQAVADPSLS
jgi:adenylate kinase family enzyme